MAFGTSHVALQERANLQPGQTVLVLGAAGGVGIAAVQVLRTPCFPATSHDIPVQGMSRTDAGEVWSVKYS